MSIALPLEYVEQRRHDWTHGWHVFAKIATLDHQKQSWTFWILEDQQDGWPSPGEQEACRAFLWAEAANFRAISGDSTAEETAMKKKKGGKGKKPY